MVLFTNMEDKKDKLNRKKATLRTPIFPRNIHIYLEWNSHKLKLPVPKISLVQSFSSLLGINTLTWQPKVLKTGLLRNLGLK